MAAAVNRIPAIGISVGQEDRPRQGLLCGADILVRGLRLERD